MNWFFADPLQELHLITGEDARHIARSLRMSVGESLTLCDSHQVEHFCRIERITEEGVLVSIVSEEECHHEPSVRVTLYASVTKGDKMEHVIQKAVELGVHRIVPVVTDRCISRPDIKTAEKKCQRYRKIAEQAAMQSQRGLVPSVEAFIDLKTASRQLPDFDRGILFYEGGGAPLRTVLESRPETIAVFTGPEGGYEESEVRLLRTAGAQIATLGKRILRAETAPLAALTAIMFHTGNLE